MRERTFALNRIAAAVALCIAVAAPGAVSAKDDPVDAATAARLNSLTQKVIAGIGEYRRAAPAQRSAAAKKLRAAAQERKALLMAMLEVAPGLALRQSLPPGLAANLPVDVSGQFESEVELSGRIVNLHRDNEATGSCSDQFYLEAEGDPLPMRLHAADRPDRPGVVHPAMPFAGERITVRALRLDNQLLIADESAIEYQGGAESGATTTTSTAAAISGTQKTLVLLASFQDKTITCSAGDVHNLVFGNTNSVHDLYRQTSNSAVGWTGATYGPYTIPYASTTCNDYTWSAELEKMAKAQGIDTSQYPRKVFVFPSNACGYLGAATVGGSTSSAWIAKCGGVDTYAHELGHNLSFRHSSTPSATYGDTSDVMGGATGALRQLHAPHKVRAGWIPSSHVLNINGSGTFTIAPTAAVNPLNAQAIVLPKPDTNDNYYISLRQGIGYDSNLSTSYKGRVSVHRGTNSSMPTYLLATLGAGGTYTDSVNGYTFTVNSIGTDAATVSVAVNGVSCARAAPSVSVSPLNQSAAPGKALSYSVTVKNNNNSGCGTTTFAFTPEVPSGWASANSPATLSLGAGASASSTWTVTSATSAAIDQTYVAKLTAYDAGATSSIASVQANYVVIGADSVPPTVSLVTPGDGSQVSGTVAVESAARDDVGVARVEFYVDGALAASDSSAPYSFGWNTRKLSGSHTLGAVAVDVAGNRSAPHSITVSVSNSKGGGGKGGGGKGGGKK